MRKRDLLNGAYDMSGVLVLNDWRSPHIPSAGGDFILSAGDEPFVMMCGYGDDPSVRVVHVPDEARGFFDEMIDAIFTAGRWKE